ncbi:MAG TPA: heme-binding protein [Pyrinomonadaceae bacterium]|nr:heme-binding protein [Pyrinomonadaceae bacterium]
MKSTPKFLLVAFALAYPNLASAIAPCHGLPTHDELKDALVAAVSAETSGLNLHMWATIVDRQGVVCAVAFSGSNHQNQWPGSRVISAQKANTGNAFSLGTASFSNGSGTSNGLALSTANLYSAVQPGGSLFGLQESNPVDPSAAYAGNPFSDPDGFDLGSTTDPMTGKKIGGINVFGGGLALYKTGKFAVGGVGVSGDTSCADHRVAWRLRHNLGFDHLLGVDGVSGDPNRPDNIVFDLNNGTGKSAGGWGHPHCLSAALDGDPATLPAVVQ